jgi:hypothetical protein
MQNQLAVNSVDGNSMSQSVTLINNILQSNNYVQGYSGWVITGNGEAEFENVVVRGEINAYSGSIGYWNISTPAVIRVIGSQSLLGTFLESSEIGSDDEDKTEGSYVGLFKSYTPDEVVVTTKVRTSNVATLTAANHEYEVGDKVTVTLEDDTSFNNGGIAVTVTAVTIDTFSYTNVGNDVSSSDALGDARLYNKDVAGLYLQDYSKALFDHGYFSNEGIKYVSAETYNLVHNPSFEYLVSNTATYSNTGWAFGTNLVATQLDNASTVTVDGFAEDFLKDDLVYTSYSAKVTWGTNTLSNSYASTNVNYTLLHNLANLQKTLYFDFYAYFNPAGAAVTVTSIARTSGSANVVLTANSHGLTVGEYIWNEFDYAVGASQGVDAYVPLKIVAANTNTFTVTVATAASSTTTITPLVRDRIYRLHPAAYDLTQINFKLPNSNTITLYEVLADDTKATWDANAAYKFFSLPYQKDSIGNYALPYHGLDGSSNLVFYNLPRLAPISNTEGTAVPYEIKINASEFARLYAIRDNTGFTNKNNVELRFPGWIYRNEATPATKIATYSTTGIYLDNITLSTEKSFFYGGAGISSQTWYVDTDKPNTASILSAKTWVNIDLDTQTSYLNHSDYVSFKSPLLKDKLVKNSGIYTINDVDNVDYKPINIGTSLISDYSSLLFTSGEYEYKLADNTYANYEALVSSRVEKDKAFLYMSTLYKNLDADGTYSVNDPNKWEASITMASGANANTEIDITAKLLNVHAPVVGEDTYFTITGDQSITGNIAVGLDVSVDNDLTVANNIYVGGLTLSNTSDTQFARRAYTNTVTDLPTGTWYTIAYNPGGSNLVSIGRATAQFVLVDRQAGKHQSVHFMASATFGDPALTILHSSAFSANAPFEAIRLKTFSTYSGAALQVYSNGSSSAVNAQAFMYINDQEPGSWELVDFIDDAEDPSTYGTTAMTDYANLVAKSQMNLELGGGLLENKFMVDGAIVAANVTNSAIYTIIQPNAATFYGNVSIGGTLTVNGSTTIINSNTVTVDDKNIVLGNVAGSSNTTANGGGISLEATTGGDKTLTWLSATGAWTSSEDFNLVTGKVYEINGTTVLSSTEVLGYAISSSNGASTIVARNGSGDFSGRGITAQNNISIGLTDGTINTPFIDFNSGATAVDYDARIITSGGSGTTGQGNVTIYAGTTSVFGGLAAAPTFTVRGATSQTGSLQVWENSGGTDLATMDKDGNLTANAVSANLATSYGYPVANVANLGTNVATFLTTPSSANFANAITGETGTGNVVFDTNAVLVTPNIGVPSYGNLASTFGYPVANIANLGTNVATFLTTPSSANLRNAVTDEAGTGALVFRGSTSASTSDIAVGWYTIAYASNTRAGARFRIVDGRSGVHQQVVFDASNNFHLDTAAGITVLHQSSYTLASAPLQKIRIKNGNVSTDGFVLQVYVDSASNSLTAYMYDNESTASWTLPTNWVADASDPGVTAYANAAAVVEVNLDSGGAGKNQMLVTGDIYAGVNAASHVLASQAYSIASNTAYTLATNNTNQSAFPALTNGVALESGFRYEFEGVLVLSHSAIRVTGSISDTIYTSFSTPTLSYGWVEYNYTTSTSATFAAGTSDTVTSDVVTTTLTNDAVANVVTSSSGTVTGYVYVRFRGSLKTSASGNLLPRVKFNLNTTSGDGSNSGIIQAGSWMRVTKVSESTGAWT